MVNAVSACFARLELARTLFNSMKTVKRIRSKAHNINSNIKRSVANDHRY